MYIYSETDDEINGSWMKAPERLIWAAQVVDTKPKDRILEIGCGTGILIELLAQKEKHLSITGIDRSAAAIRQAYKRQREYIEQGKVQLVRADFLKADLDTQGYNSIVAFNVNFFWKGLGDEITRTKFLLKKGGKLYMFHQAPYEINTHAAEPVKKNLRDHGLAIVGTALKKLHPFPALVVVAQK